jgi:toxin-antitoxin system PIN domain toxin
VIRRSVRNRAEDSATFSASNAQKDLPDVNVWVALAIQEHPYHARALQYWSEGSAARIWFCRVTMLGLIRLLTQKAVAKDAAMSLQEAMNYYAEISSLPNIAGVAAEPPEVEVLLRNFVDSGLPSKHLTDAYLASFAVAAGLRLVSFDKDFERFEGLTLLRLST